MDWLNNLDSDHSLYEVAEECQNHMAESYYLLLSEQKQEQLKDD